MFTSIVRRRTVQAGYLATHKKYYSSHSLPEPSLSSPTPKYPIVLCHGLLGFNRLGPFEYFKKVKKELQKRGAIVEVTAVSPTSSIAHRAAQLKEQLLPITAKFNTKVHIIAHSMGGLDSRYLISHLGGNEYPSNILSLLINVFDLNTLVRSLTTLATPHHGSSIATWGISRIGERLRLIDLLKHLHIPYEAFLQLSPEYINQEFNPATLDHPEVAYFSHGASKLVSIANPLFFFNQMLQTAEGENDGLVSVTSAKWGEYLGTTPCDHMELINWSPLYDASPIYVSIAASLSKYEQAIVQASGP